MSGSQEKTLLDEAPSYPFEREDPMEPPTEILIALETQRAQQVLLFNGRRIWLVTNHQDVRQVLASESISNFVNHESMPKLSPLDGKGNDENPSFLHLDHPEHRVLRRPLAQFFTRKRAAAMRPYIDQMSHNLILDLRARKQPVDFVAHFARKLPAFVTCQLLGLPAAETVFFTRSTLASISTDHSHQSKTSAVLGLRDRIAKAIRERQQALDTGAVAGDTVIDQLLLVSDISKDFEDLISSVQVLLVGGLETTANALAFAVLHASANPENWLGLSEGAKTCENFVEEVLRYYTIFDIGLTRAVVAPLTLSCGSVMRPGDGVVVSLSAANRDPRVFALPGRFATDRQRCPHLAFGHGPHFCIGHFLAREILNTSLFILAKTLPTLRVAAPVSEIPFSFGQAILGPLRLPVCWDCA